MQDSRQVSVPVTTIWAHAKHADDLAFKAVELGAMNLRRTVAIVFTFFIFCAYAPPTIMAIQMGIDPDVRFWIGSAALWTIAIPIILLIQHGIHLSMIENPAKVRLLMFWCAIFPGAWFAIIGGVYMNEADFYAYEMRSSSCESMVQEKAELQAAYEDAQEIRETCVKRLTADNGGKPLPYFPVVTLCEEYQQQRNGTRKYEWNYLAKCEINHLCSGFCDGGKYLWSGVPGEGLPCARHVGQKMLVAQHQALMLLVYGILMIAVSFLVYMMVSPILKQLGYIPSNN